MPKNILTIGLELASDDVHHEEFESKASLLDWDIILFKPSIDGFYSFYSERYLGKPCLSEADSFSLKEACEHWRREIKQALEAGKTIVVYLPALKEVYVDTGERTYSGTGRNQKTTRMVTLYSNYSCLPVKAQPVNAKGTAIKLSARGSEIIASYWSEFNNVSEYNVVLSADNIPACLVTRNGDRPVGAIYRSKNSSGALLLLPEIDFEPDHFVDEESSEWTDDACRFAARLLNAVISLDKSIRSVGELTPEPVWAVDAAYELAQERRLRIELLDAERQVEEAQRRKEALLEDLKLAGRLRGLLYEKGKPLENAIIDALQLLGFKAESYQDASSEFDVVFESNEGRLIGEVEGKDGKPINVDKLRQLTMNVHEDLQREEVDAPAKGVLFGNGYRLQPVSGRGVFFTAKCISAAQASSTALVSTVDLFKVASYLSDRQDPLFAQQCREAILKAVGVASLPDPPALEVPPKGTPEELD